MERIKDHYIGNNWTKCSDLIDSTICNDQFLTCVDNSSIKKDTVYLYDTLKTSIILNDTSYVNFTKYDTLILNDTVITHFLDTLIIIDTLKTYDTLNVQIILNDTIIDTLKTYYYDTSYVQVTLKDTIITQFLDTLRTIDTISKETYHYDTLNVQVTLKDTIILIDTTYKELFNEVKLWIEIPKITYIDQKEITESPYFYGKLDSLLYNLNDSDIVSVNWSIYVYDNIGQVINQSIRIRYFI